MKKHLLMMLSWAMLMAGAASFASCSDDDDDDKAATPSAVYENYSNQSGAFVDGDNVVWVSNMGTKMVYVYHFNGNTMDAATIYISCLTETAANKLAEEAKKEGAKNVSVDGTVVAYQIADDDEMFEGFKELSKDELVEGLKEMSEMMGDVD